MKKDTSLRKRIISVANEEFTILTDEDDIVLSHAIQCLQHYLERMMSAMNTQDLKKVALMVGLQEIIKNIHDKKK